MKAQKRTSRAMVASGSLVFVALIGPRFVDWLWLALLPAAVLFALAIPRLGRGQTPAGVRVAALFTSFVFLVLVGLAVAGLLIQRSLGVEPAWLTLVVTRTAWLSVLGVAAYGVAGAVTRSLPRPAALTLALSLPLGFGLDAVMTQVPGLFLHGAGFYLGAGLFALSVVRLGRWAGRLNLQDVVAARAAGKNGTARTLEKRPV